MKKVAILFIVLGLHFQVAAKGVKALKDIRAEESSLAPKKQNEKSQAKGALDKTEKIKKRDEHRKNRKEKEKKTQQHKKDERKNKENARKDRKKV